MIRQHLGLRLLMTLGLGVLSSQAFPATGLDADRISSLAGTKATETSDGVVRLAWPRSDVPLRVDGVAMPPFAGVSSWAAFTVMGKEAMLMGDTVVFQDEINPAIDAAFAHGLEVSALHNHFVYDEPKVLFMHIGGHGNVDKLATGVKAVWDAIKAVRSANPAPAQRFEGASVATGVVTVAPLEKILGGKAEAKDGMVKLTIGRDGKMHGIKVGASMGLTTWAAFVGTDSSAVVDGDFIMTANEVQIVLHALREAKINIVALHNHMIGEVPGVYFTHFWGKGAAADLARGLKTALDAQTATGKQKH